MTLLFEINGNDAFDYLKEGSLTHEVSGIARRATLSCTLLDMPGLDNLQTVEWDDSDGTHFLGFVSSITRQTTSKRGQGVTQVVQCRDISFRAYDLMISSLHGRRTTFEFSDDVVADVVGYHWPELDLTAVTAHVTVKPKDYTQFTVGDFLDDIAKLAGAIWYVDADLALHFIVPAYTAAPFNLSDQPNGTTTFGWEPDSLTLQDEAEEINNRIYTRGKNLPYKNYDDDDSIARYGVRYGSINSNEIDTRAEMDAAAAAMLAEKAWPKREGSCTILEPGLSSGMEFALTALDHELSAAPQYTVSVQTKYPQWNSPRYTVKFVGDKDRPIGPEGTPPAEPGPSEPSTPSKTLAEELRKRKGGAAVIGDENCCPPPPPYKPKPEDADGSSVSCEDEPNFAGGTSATVTFGTAPTVGNIIVMWVSAYGNAGEPDLSGVSVDFAFTGLTAAHGYDAAQYGGPGGYVGLAMAYRVVTGSDTGTYAVSNIPGGSNNSHVYMCEFEGISGAPEVWTDEGTMFGGGTYAIGTGLSGFVVGGRAHQRTNYAPPDVVTVNGATEHWNADLDGGTGPTTAEAPWVVLGYGNGPWSTSIASNPNLDRWGYGAVAFGWTVGQTETLVPTEGQDVPWESGVGDGVTTDHVTNYPYEPGSLIVTADGVVVIPDETDPDAGEFTIYSYALGTPLAWRYQAQNGIPTGANNAEALPTNPVIGAAAGYWEPVTDGDVAATELVFEDGDIVMEYVT